MTDAAPTASATPEKSSKLHAAARDAGEWLFKVLLSPFVEISALFKLLWEALFWGIRPPYRGRLFVEAMEFIGIGSIFLVSLTAVFVGGVLALQLAFATSAPRIKPAPSSASRWRVKWGLYSRRSWSRAERAAR